MPGAFVIVNCEPDSSESLASVLRQLSNVEFVFRTSGVYDLLIKVNAQTDEDLKKVITQIRTNNQVKTTSTLMIFGTFLKSQS